MLVEATALPHVTGHCPACGRSSLFLSPAGEVICTHLGCNRPDTVTRLIADPNPLEHIVVLDHITFSVRHPIAERIDDALMSCSLHPWLQALPGPPAPPGRYRATEDHAATPDQPRWRLERTTDAPAA